MSTTIPTAMELFDALNRGVPLTQNPISSVAAPVQLQATQMRDQVTLQKALMDPSDPSFPVLNGLESTLSDAHNQITALNSHAETMINGDNSGSVISGGLAANISQATSALSLNNQMAALGYPTQGSTSSTDACAIFGDFFNTLIGMGQELIGQIQAAIQEAIQPLRDLINQINTAIGTAIQDLRDAITQITARIRAAISDITNAISSELANFAKWLNLQFNFNLSSFLPGLFNNACAQLVLRAVVTPAAMAVLAASLPAAARPIRPLAGRMW